MLDASRVVDVVSALLDPERRSTLDLENRELQERLRVQHAEKTRKPLLPLESARANRRGRLADRAAGAAVRGQSRGRAAARRARAVHRLAVLLPRVGPEGQVPGDPRQPGGARAVRRRAALLRAILQGASLHPEGVYGFWPAYADGEDVVVGDTRFSFLRQQADHGDGRPNRCLADYVAPADDYVGAFAVAIHGADELAARYQAAHDDYSAIAVKALADRLAEAFAEWLHRRARREWYAPDEHLSEEDLPEGELPRHPAGIRLPRVPGSQREAASCSSSSDAERAGMALTETYSMLPASAVSGLYFHHPQAKYFAVGRIGPGPGGGLRATPRNPAGRGRDAGCPRTWGRAAAAPRLSWRDRRPRAP